MKIIIIKLCTISNTSESKFRIFRSINLKIDILIGLWICDYTEITQLSCQEISNNRCSTQSCVLSIQPMKASQLKISPNSRIFQEMQSLEKCIKILTKVKRFNIWLIIHIYWVIYNWFCSSNQYISTALLTPLIDVCCDR
jgi:hypothetical protein